MKTVIVTGASRGIGAAVVRALRARDTRVIGVARSSDALQKMSMEKMNGGKFEFVSGDITDAAVRRQCIDLAACDGALDGLVLNAAVLEPFARTIDFDDTLLDNHINVNITSQIKLIREALPALRSAHGKIIFVTSGIVDHPMPGWSLYAASKAAIQTLFKCLSMEEPSITCVCVRPGIVDTQMVHEAHAKAAEVMGDQGKQWLDNLRNSNGLLSAEVPGEAISKLVLEAPSKLSGKCISFNDKW